VCGIAGYVGSEPGFNAQLLKNQSDCLEHRGPDDEGIYVGNQVGFSFRRLSIIDVAHGSQPCFNENQEVVSIFNGEIYNFYELRQLLQSKGHKLVSVGDSEVIPHLYEEFGVQFLEHLEGMFAIALWDNREQKLLLARDRFGEKPLWFESVNGNLLFGSEVKALLKFKKKRNLDYVGISKNLLYGYSGVSKSCIEGVRMVSPASYVTFKDGVIEERCYWSPEINPKTGLTIDGATEELISLLNHSIKQRLISERSIGIFLSGGIDSSLIATLTSQLLPESINTFSLGFEDSSFDESKNARITAERIGSKHHETILRPDAKWIFEELPKILDYPFADSSFMPTYFLSKFASQSVTVALSGDGGDEAFGGYDRYRFNLWWQKLTLGSFSYPKNHELKLQNRRLGKWMRSLQFRDPQMRYEALTQLISKSVLVQILKPDFVRDMPNRNLELPKNLETKTSDSLLRWMQLHDLRNYLPGDLMFKIDYASMSHGLEVRTPFLSHKVVEFGLNLPAEFKIGLRRNKLILRHLGSRYLDERILNQKKRGFAIPRANWIRGPLRNQVTELLLDEDSFVGMICNRAKLEKLLLDHMGGAERDEILWPLIILEMWHKRFLEMNH